MPALNGARVLVAAGGTGGHLTPALAVADELAARGALITFVTTPSQVARLGARYDVVPLAMRGFDRRLLSRTNLTTLRRLAVAAPRAWAIVGRTRPVAAVGGGGYLSGPVVAAAAVRGVPSLAIESDAHLGVANRLLKPFVKRLCLSFPIEGLEPPKYVLTGRPLSATQLAADAARGRELFGLRDDLPVVVAFGGSQGAQSINRACSQAFSSSDLDLQLIHVCGERNFAAVEKELAEVFGFAGTSDASPAGGTRFERYHLLAYTDHLAHAMAAADLIVGRSGGSVAEIAALGRPAILVPFPHATADHQRKNARSMVEGGAAVMIDDAELTGKRLGSMVRELLADRERLAAMAAASRSLGHPDATRRVADEVERLAGGARART